MVLTAPIPWTSVMTAIHSWVESATGITARWADQPEPRADYPYVLLDIVSGPLKEGGIDEVERTVDLTRFRDVKVTPVAQNNTLYRVTINGTDFDFTSDADATVAEITAGLAAAILGGSEPVSAVDNGTDLDIVGDGETLNPATPQLFNMVLFDDFDGSQMTAANNDFGNEVEFRVTGQREITVNVQAYERNTDEDNPATDPARNAYHYLSLLQASLGLPSIQQTLRLSGIALIEEGPLTDISEATEDTFESRASMDVRMRVLADLREYVGFVDQVDLEGTYSAEDGDTTQSFSATG